MEWKIGEILIEVKRVCYHNIRSVERLMFFSSLAQNTALRQVREQREQEKYLFTLQELASQQTFNLIRTDLLLLCRVSESDRRKAFYPLRRRLIENIAFYIRQDTAPEKGIDTHMRQEKEQSVAQP